MDTVSARINLNCRSLELKSNVLAMERKGYAGLCQEN